MDDLESEFRLPEEQLSEKESSDDDSVNRKRIKKVNLPIAPTLFKEVPNETGFHQTTRICLQKIREAMLNHRWQEAAEFMISYSQSLEDTTAKMPPLSTEIIWRLGIELLHNHPDTKLEDYNSLYERVKYSGVKNYLKVCLEHSSHLLVNGKFDDAKRQLSNAISWRYGKQSAAQPQTINLIQAYSGFLDYFIWCDKKNSNTGENDEVVNQEMHSYFRQSSVNMKEIMKVPGVWDPFILSYIDMLEFYSDHQGALKVLTDYAYENNFPPNPNAHIYLYRFMKKHNHPTKNLLKLLKILHTLVPSHELMLEYCTLLLETDNEEGLQQALRVLLELLDYACWRSNLDVWTQLRTILKRLIKLKQGLKIIAEEMANRKDWWLAMHFTAFHARRDRLEDKALLQVKSRVLPALCPQYVSIYRSSASKIKADNVQKDTDSRPAKKDPTTLKRKRKPKCRQSSRKHLKRSISCRKDEFV
ncbi:hypothetical protein UPYG_G00275130 [Umbra pygmaea]|uniref:TATA box-binding protein-associated factor RNA polymerase I subunit A n=1 Tax=Umbra pygmaea TaxID=75934 RepID=A0ABD0W6H4_UMBPY